MLFLGRRLGRIKLRELRAAAGGLDYAAVSIAVKRFERRVKNEKKLAQLVKQATAKLCTEDRYHETGYGARNIIHWPITILGTQFQPAP